MEGKLIDGLAQMGAEEDLMSALIKAAQSDARPTVIDWGDLKVEDLSKPLPRYVPFADRIKKTDEEIVHGPQLSTGRAIVPIQVEGFEQLLLF